MRPLSNGKADRYELVAGARRYRASKAAGRDSIPARVVVLSDIEAAEIQCTENLLREDIHELDEASSYARLLELGRDYTPDVIALKVGKSRQYVTGRLQLLKLEPKLKDSFYRGQINVAVALRLARLQPANQLAAFKYFQGNGHCSTEFTATVRDVDEWIKREVFLNLDSAAFTKDDATLYPEAGPCTTCPKRTGASPLLFPDLQKNMSNVCMLCGIWQSRFGSSLATWPVRDGSVLPMFGGLPEAKPCGAEGGAVRAKRRVGPPNGRGVAVRERPQCGNSACD